jgi:NADH:ubiquinone oxidoreductase subunit H
MLMNFSLLAFIPDTGDDPEPPSKETIQVIATIIVVCILIWGVRCVRSMLRNDEKLPVAWRAVMVLAGVAAVTFGVLAISGLLKGDFRY